MSQSIISGNTEVGVRNLDASVLIQARGNFWGHASGPLDVSNTDGRNQTNPNGQGDRVSEYVDWGGFLAEDIIKGPTTDPGSGGSGGEVDPAALCSDSFNRPDAGSCGLGRADNALGGVAAGYYVPLFPTGVPGDRQFSLAFLSY